MTTTPRSRPRSPGRWTGSAAGTRRGRCRPPARSPRPVNVWAAGCSLSCSRLFERVGGPVAGPVGMLADRTAVGTARGSFLRGWRLVAIDGFEVDLPDSPENAAEFGYAGSGTNRSAFPKARVVAVAECGTHAFLTAEIDAYKVGERTLAQRLYPRLRRDELLVADRGFYSYQAWDTAAATGAALLWRAPTQLALPVVRVLPDGTYLSVVMEPAIRGTRRERILTAAKDGDDLTDHPDATDERGWPLARLVRIVEYTVPDRVGNGTGELIVLLSTVLDPADAHADELAVAYNERWEQETGNDQLKTHLRGPGKVLRSRLPDLVHQEIYCAMKRSVISPAQRGEIGGTSLDPMANSPPKGDSGEDNSMPGN